jgi:hypothetical protein
VAKKASSKASSPTRQTRTGGKDDGLRVPMHSVVHFMRMLHDEKHTAKFVKAARAAKAKATVTLHPSTVRFIKKYVADNELHGAMTAKVVDPCPDDPFECHFRD